MRENLADGTAHSFLRNGAPRVLAICTIVQCYGDEWPAAGRYNAEPGTVRAHFPDPFPPRSLVCKLAVSLLFRDLGYLRFPRHWTTADRLFDRGDSTPRLS